MGKARIGISGWTFPAWRGKLYPKGLSHKRELEFASRKLSTIEVNGTFYSLQRPSTFERWHAETPDGFQFAVKAPQFITHVRRLKDCETPLANFLASGVLCLKEKLGPILWQFPPNVMLKDDRFEKFLAMLPHDSVSAAKIARGHSDWLKGRASLDAHGDFPIRHAFELRHPSFFTRDFIELLREHNVALVIAHAGKKCPYAEDLTADFVYARLHGEGKGYAKGYPGKELAAWAERIASWTAGTRPKAATLVSKARPAKIARDVFVYFSTEAKVHAPASALALVERLAQSPVRRKKAA